jgi:hypothetical protein
VPHLRHPADGPRGRRTPRGSRRSGCHRLRPVQHRVHGRRGTSDGVGTRAISGTAGYGGPTEEHAAATKFAAVRSGGGGSEPILRGRADNFFIILNLEHTPGFEAGDEFMLVAFAPHPVVLRKLQIKLPQSVPSTGLLRLSPE